MCTSLMSLFGSIIDQSQEYYSFNDVTLIIVWCKRTVNKLNWPCNNARKKGLFSVCVFYY